MKRLAILVNEDTMQRCTCSGCMGAFIKRKDAFAEYGDDVELVCFTHSGGDLERKVNMLLKKEIDVVHLSSCTKSKNPNYETIVAALLPHFDVVGYTHGTREGAERDALFMKKLNNSEEN